MGRLGQMASAVALATGLTGCPAEERTSECPPVSAKVIDGHRRMVWNDVETCRPTDRLVETTDGVQLTEAVWEATLTEEDPK